MRRSPRCVAVSPRRGASLDYVLVISATLPVVLICVTMGKRIMQLVWEMLCVQVSWPFL
jgi:hypothetical protein